MAAAPHILIVEDERIVALDLRQSLVELGYDVAGVVSSGDDALALARERPIDLALMDIHLKGPLDGIETARLLRTECHVPVIYLTAYQDEATLGRAKVTTPYGYLVKPFDVRHLAATLEMAIYKRHLDTALSESEARLSSTLRSISDGVVTTDLAGRVNYINPTACTMTGWTQDSARGTRVTEVVSIVDGDTGAPANWFGLESDGVLASSRPPYPSLVAKDGRLTPIDGRSAPIQDDTGRPFGTVLVLRDISERVLAEAALRQSEERLRHSQKMEVIGRLASGVAHDLNNLLTVVTGYNELLMASLTDDRALARAVEVNRAAERAAALVRRLVTFGRRHMSQPRVIDFNELLEEMEGMLLSLVGEHIRLTTFPKALGHVEADAGHLEQVIMNLVVNARDAMPDGGLVTIETSDVWLDEAHVEKHVAIPEGQYVLLTVTDSGSGMDAETQSHLFEPFFTTKQEGTGLGLATTYGIVKQAGGYILVDSDVGRGSCFKVYLPRIARPVEPVRLRPLAIPPSGGETILVVEDEPGVRALVVAVLQAQGYNVLAAEHARQALAIAAVHPGPIHLIVTDIVMPEVTGPELIRQLAPTRPDAAVVYMSGYSANAIFHGGVLDRGVAFVQKPFTTIELVRKVREVLDRRDTA